MSDSLSKFEPVEQLAEEFLARYRGGERPSLSEYTRAHPELAELIREYFPAMVLMEQLGPGEHGSTPGEDPGRGGKGKIPEQLGEYRILREMGRGGMGIVYEAAQETLGRHVALKVLPFCGLLDQTHLERFHREARAAARLHHTNIVPVFGVGEHQGIQYYAMQFIHGQSLDEVLQELRRLRRDAPTAAGPASPHSDIRDPCKQPACTPSSSPPQDSDPAMAVAASGSQASSVSPSSSKTDLSGQTRDRYFRSVATIGVQVAEALEYAHTQGILHRDVKPSNLLLDTSGQVWVTDFGLAKVEDWEELTHPGDVVGTLRYMAPERFQGKADVRSDVYGLGITLYEMLTLRPAFEDCNRARLMERVAHEEPPRPRKLDRQIPRDLETVVLKATAKESAQRYATAAALAEDLRRYLGDRPIQARRTPLRERVWRWCRRNPVVALLTTAVVLLLLLLGGGALVKNAQLSRALADAEAANLVAKEKLWVSLRDRAHALRLSRQSGQRVDTLRSVREALHLPLPPGHSLGELRTAAIAALALPDLELLREWEGFPAGSRDLAFDHNLERYARLAANGAVTVYQVSDDAPIAHWQESTETWPDQESYLRFSPDGRFLCTRHATTRRLTVRRLDGPEPPVFYEGPNPATGWVMDFSPDNKRLAYIQSDNRIAMVDLASRKVHYVPDVPATGVVQEHIRFAPDGRRFAVAARGAGRSVIEVRDADTGQVQQRLPHPLSAYHPAWHPDGQILATCCDDRLIRLWDVASGRLLCELAGHKSLGINCAFTPSGDRLVSNDWSNVLRVWEPASGRQLLARPAAGYAVLQVGPDERLPAIHVADVTKVQLLRLHAGLEYRTIGPRGYLSRGLADKYPVTVHHRGRLLGARAVDGSLLLVDLSAGREVGRIAVDPRMTPLRWQPRTGDLFTFGVQGLLRWPSRAELATPGGYRLGPPKQLLTGDFLDGLWGSSADAQTIVVPDGNGGARVIDLKNPSSGSKRILVRLRPQQDVRCCAVSPDGRWAATASHDSTAGVGAKVWNAATGEAVQALPVPGRCAVAFSPDGRWLLTTSGGCRLWQVGSWQRGPHIGGASGCFSPDGQLLAAEDSAGAIRLVRPDTGAELARLEAPEQTRLQPTGFSPDGARLIAVGIDTEALHIWDLRRFRERLTAIGLDWDAPEYAPPASSSDLVPLELEILPVTPFGCLEAESLKIVDRAGCAPSMQSMDQWDRSKWSQGRQLFCDTRQGGFVDLEIDIPQAGKYQLGIYFTMAPDFGILEVSLGGKQVGSRFDGFSGGVVPSGRIAFGAVQLTRGKHQIRFTVVDKNPASANYYMGIDCLELKPVKD
jgi:serine/threonine protein kinase/WD40 repeat protein